MDKLGQKLLYFENIVLLKESFFGIPWMLVGALLPFADISYQIQDPFAYVKTVLYMLMAFFSCRIAGMCLNRIIDRHIDGKNPRTVKRALPERKVHPLVVLVVAFFFLAVFIFATSNINVLTFRLSFFAVLLLALYSYTKRFTSLCHFVLGTIHFFSPLCAWVSITGSIAIAPILVGAAVFCSISANDIIYALQDVEVDQEQGLFSIPARFGKTVALLSARILHLACLVFLVCCAKILVLSPIFYGGIVCIGIVFFYYHLKIQKEQFETIQTRFSSSNIVSGFVLLFFTLEEVVCRVIS